MLTLYSVRSAVHAGGILPRAARHITTQRREKHMGKGNNRQKNDKKNMKAKKNDKKQEIKSRIKK